MHVVPNIDNLRGMATPLVFGLGMIQIKPSEDSLSRYHFYHPDLVNVSHQDEFHSHRYSFTSEVLIGSLEQSIAPVISGGELGGANMSAFEVCCAGKSQPKPVDLDIAAYAARTVTPAGGSYYLRHDHAHRLHDMGMALTLQQRMSDAGTDYPSHVFTRGEPSHPFDIPAMSRSHIWEIVEDVLSLHHGRPVDMDNVGYHIRDIPRGDLGYPSKIIEEIMEFSDAVDQGNPVMALVELSDSLGAIEAYLERHHPSVTLDDLLTMKAATQRAFRNGFRT